MFENVSGNDAGTTGSSPRSEDFTPGGSPQALNQLQATGAEVLGCDGEKIGDLREVRDADFSVGRSALKRDLNIPVTHIQSIDEDENVILDVSSKDATDMGWEGDFLPSHTDSTANFSDNAKAEKGAFGIVKEETD